MSIDQLLQIVDKATNWCSSSLQGDKQSNARRNFLNFKRQLNKKKFALSGNPAAALYGESQMGKSYLVSSLLSESGRPFTIVDVKDNKYDFINQINPIGGGAESTSLVTRFSTAYEVKNPDFPIQAKLLSPSDLILVLCDSYYNDIKTKIDVALREDDINNSILELCKKYNHQEAKQSLLKEEDILDISDYFRDNFFSKSANVIHSKFFEITAATIEKIQPNEWFEIIELLWNKNSNITKLYKSLINYYGQLDFSEVVFLPIDAVLREQGTLLDVLRLYEISESTPNTGDRFNSTTSLLLIKNQQEKIIYNFSKSYLCALSAELIFQVPKDLESSKPFLKNTDLLDFPGARHRLGIHEEDIEDTVIPKMLLRGKVAYLFKKYSKAEKINILLFCHSHRQSAQSVMPELLKGWIDEMIGKSATDRQSFIDRSKIPPLFVISTMFNLDLQYDLNNDKPDNRSYRDNRWLKRFDRVLKTEIFGSENEPYNWIENWTINSPNFQNIYLLRDFYYSSETNSQIYKGYNESKIEIEEIIPHGYPDFRKDLRKSFVEYPFIQNHFEDPGHSWDSAVNINADGTKLIIDRLTITAANINIARLEKNSSEFSEIKASIVHELKKYYHDTESDLRIQKAKSIAGNVQLRLDVAFGENPYFFGQLMKSLMISKSRAFEFFMEKIKNVELRDISNPDKYAAIRMSVKNLNPKYDFETNLELLCMHYGRESKEECKVYFESEGIDLNELFYGQIERVKNFAQIFSEELEHFWFENYMIENKETLTKIFTVEELQNLVDMLRALFKKLGISEVIASKIRHYAEEYKNSERTYEMIADISSELINKFISGVGFEFYKEQDISELRYANEKNSLGLMFDHEELKYEENNHAEAATLITKMRNLSSLLNQQPLPIDVKRLPFRKNFIAWYNLLKIGFISVCDIPNYDVHANKKLKAILDEFQPNEK